MACDQYILGFAVTEIDLGQHAVDKLLGLGYANAPLEACLRRGWVIIELDVTQPQRQPPDEG